MYSSGDLPGSAGEREGSEARLRVPHAVRAIRPQVRYRQPKICGTAVPRYFAHSSISHVYILCDQPRVMRPRKRRNGVQNVWETTHAEATTSLHVHVGSGLGWKTTCRACWPWLARARFFSQDSCHLFAFVRWRPPPSPLCVSAVPTPYIWDKLPLLYFCSFLFSLANVIFTRLVL